MTPTRRRSDAAKKQARYRARLRGCRFLASVEVSFDVVAAMIDKDLISPEGSRNRQMLGAAVADLLERLVLQGSAS